MSRHFTCRHGHQWELSATSSSLTAHLDPVCPVCGAPAQTCTADTGKSDSDSVRVPLAPAPVETKSRVPAPLPVRQAALSTPPPPTASRAGVESGGRAATPGEIVSAQKMSAISHPAPPVSEPPPVLAPRSVIRHPGVAALATAAAFLPILIVVGFVLPQHRIAEERSRADEARRQAELAEQQALQLRQAEAMAKADLTARLRDAEQARTEALEQRDRAKLDAVRADKGAQEIERRRQEQANLREQAELAAKLAQEARDEALKGRGGAEGNFAHLYAGQGVRSMERGELFEALVWLTEALRLGQGDADREAPQRLRLAAILAQCPRPVQVWCHEKIVTQASFSTDGRRVLTLAKDGKARLWNAADGKAVGDALAGDTDVVLALFSRDGRHVLTASADNTARIWDAADGKPITPLLEHTGTILALATSPDGKRLHTISRDPMARGPVFHAWNASTGDAVDEPWEFTHAVQTAVFSPDGSLIVTSGLDGLAYVTELSGKESYSAFDQDGPLRQITFSSDGRLVATCAGKSARVWNTATREAISPALAHPDEVSLIAVSPDGRRAATVCADRAIRIWDVAIGKQVGYALRQRALPTTLTFAPDGRHLLTAGADGNAHVLDVVSGQEIVPTLWHSSPVLPGAVFSPDGARVLAASGAEARVWDLTAGEPLVAVPEKTSDRVTFTSDGKRFIRITGDTAQLVAADTGKVIGEAMKHKHDVSLAIFSADGRRLLTVAQRPGPDSAEVELQLWDAANGAAVGPPIELLRQVQVAAVSPDGSRAAAATTANVVHVWDTTTGKELGKSIDYRNDPVSHVLFSPDGGKLISAATSGEVRVSDPATGEPLGPPLKHSQAITYLAISPDGKRLTTASADGAAQVTETASGEAIAGPFQHGAPVQHFVMSEDGGRAATAGTDGSARIWDAKTAKQIGPTLRHDNAVSQVAFSPDGRWLATASGDHVRWWDAATGEPLSGEITPWRGGTAVTFLTFAKDGRLVAGYGQLDDPRTKHTLHLTPDSRPPAELTQLATLVTGHHLDPTGVLVNGELGDIRKAWEALHSKWARDLANPPERLLAWHRRGADECEQSKQWTGALLHAARLAELEPKHWQHRVRRAKTFAAMKQWQQAWEEYRKALELAPERPDLLAGAGMAEMELKNWQSASEWLSRAIALKPDDRDLWAERGRAYAELGKFEKAATDIEKAMNLGQNDAASWHQRLLLRLAAGDLEGYRKACQRMVRRFGSSEDAETVRLVAWTCALAPEALSDLGPLIRRAEKVAQTNPKSVSHSVALAALLYRSGQFTAASQRLEEARKLGSKDQPVLLFQAMTLQRLGRSAEAKKLFGQVAKDDDPSVKALPWNERLALRLLRKEAEKLIG